jgi:hypothetical protein
MKPLKYKFFLTSATQPMALVFKEGASIDPDTGFVAAGSNYAYTSKAPVGSLKYLYFNLPYDYKGTATIKPFIQFYNSSNKVVGNYPLYGAVIEVPTNADQYAVCIRTSDYPAYQFKDDNFFFLALDEAKPHYKKLTKKVSKEGNEMFYRDSLTGDITFHNADFDAISGMALTSKGVFIIAKSDKSFMYKQEFSKVDFEIDYFRKSAKLKLKTTDIYTDILAKRDKKFNITKIGAAMARVAIQQKPVIQLYAMGSDAVSSYYNGSYSEDAVSGPQDDFKTLVQDYHFAYCASVQEFEITEASDSKINGAYSGQGGVYTNANGCTAKILPANSSWASLYLYRPDGTLYGYTDNRSVYSADDFSGIKYDEMGANYPHCVYIIETIYDDRGEVFRIATGDSQYKTVSGKIKNIITNHIMGRILTAIRGGNTITIPSGSSVTTQDLREDDFAYSGRNYKSAIPFEATVYSTAVTSNTPTEYGFNDYGKYFTDDFSGAPGKVWPLGKSLWGNASIWYANPSNFKDLISATASSALINDTYTLRTVINKLLEKNELPIEHRNADSKFLYDDTDPVLQTSRWKNILLTPITNILKSDYTQAAQRGDISLEMIFDMLRKVFNCYWYIEDGRLKIEHISFFLNNKSYSVLTPTAKLDITALTDQFNAIPYSYSQHKIAYDTKDLASQYIFSYPEETTEAFTNVKLIMQKVPYVDPSVDEEVKVEMFSADIDSMMLKPDDFNNDNLALLCPDLAPTGGYAFLLKEHTIKDDKNCSYKIYPQNWHASWVHLLNYHLADIPTLATTNSLGIILNVIPIQKAFAQQTIKLPEALSIEPYLGIKTDVGVGLVESIDTELDTGVAEIQLKHKPIW